MSRAAPSEWPRNELEFLGKCPVCGYEGRSLIHQGLEDIIFKCAPGKWDMHRCDNCHSAYLDPRPDEASISKAYEVYFTHADADSSSISDRLKHNRLFEKAYNGRLNSLYGFKRNPHSGFLGALVRMVPFVGHFFDPFGRAIPLPPHENARILDFGCGDGRFLALAREAGWDCTGIDFDPEAVAVAQTNGLNVQQGGFDALSGMKGFDRITLSHVIEHVHDPKKVIRACYNALNLGGVLWMETPNIDAYGNERFGKYWRGLECPRHLAIFTPKSLGDVTREVGFDNIRNTPRLFVNLTTYSASSCAKEGYDRHARSLSKLLRPLPLWDGIRSIFNRNKTEFIQITGRKPG